jgi:hypothetical protein
VVDWFDAGEIIRRSEIDKENLRGINKFYAGTAGFVHRRHHAAGDALPMILRECRDRLQTAGVPKSDWPDLSDPKQLPVLSLPAWQVVMQMDLNSPTLPEKIHVHVDSSQIPQFQIESPPAGAIPTVPPGRRMSTTDAKLVDVVRSKNA